MAKIDITKTELVWPGKYNEDGTLKEVPKADLPFQVIETVNESRATREVQKTTSLSLFDVYEGKEGNTFSAGWRNKLIWGDNLLVMRSLLERFAGKIDLIYIDPPFAVGADFGFRAAIGEANTELDKEPSAIESKSYRDTWGRGYDSYLEMLFSRLSMMRDLLSEKGTIYVHVGPTVSHYVRCLLENVFGSDKFVNEVIWRRAFAHNDPARCGQIHDSIYIFQKGDERTWNTVLQAPSADYIEQFFDQYDEDRKERYNRLPLDAPRHGDGGNLVYEWKGAWPAPNRTWAYVKDKMKEFDRAGRIHYPKSGGMPRMKRYESEYEGTVLQDIWTDLNKIHNQSQEQLGYNTQKPEVLLDRIIRSSSNEGDLVADFFSGSGTTLAVAEKLGRRWIGCDLGRWGVHITRKRLLGIENCRPFEVLNLGKYERQYWQGVTFGKASDKPFVEQAIYQYLAFILKLYGAQPVAGLTHLHGKKGRAFVHIGAVDAPVTIVEIDAAVEECAKLKQSELHVLGWEWEMGLYDLMVGVAKKKQVKLLPLQIPREVMELRSGAKEEVRFFELAYLEADIKKSQKLTAQVSLRDFVIPNTELIPEDVRAKVKRWSDYIDYWAVDWDFRNDSFMQGWVAYRTRQERKLLLQSDSHAYDKAGKYRILVKVIDIFGNDTSQAFDVEVK
jgi:adenine-specific DNA-methyltransferase